MLPKEITSLQHPIVKHFVKLRENKKFRYENKQIVLAGIKQVEEAKDLEILLTKKNFAHSLKAKEQYIVTDAILKKVTGLETPEPASATVPMPSFQSLQGKKWILAIDGISDPGNLGTLIRTALALGFEGAFLTETSVDPFNDKALRSAKGAALCLPLQKGSVQDLIDLAKDLPTFLADLGGENLSSIKPQKSALLILGNEANGPSPELKKKFPSITIPISSIDSLNVAAAGAIIMYTLHHDR